MSIAHNLKNIKNEIDSLHVTLIAVSKTKPQADVLEAYHAGQRIFGENLVQELTEKYQTLPKDIQWHLIGHLQRNKVKYIAPFISLIHSVDSLKLLKEINKEGAKNNRVIPCLLQIYIADEETKYGLGFDEAIELLVSPDYKGMQNISIVGLMGIATNTDKQSQIKEEFYELKTFFNGVKQSFFKNDANFKEISMGMTSDYKLAIEQGATMVRIGSDIFGKRDYTTK
ncbi:MAG: YggS family pyridoxal phosphate-dependent enzyme [Sphingobacteriales bacterium]|nr:MAG: YggS family pyridoxal phosphate-dependent enzyme [Sphingobacteriales bacterium]TAF84013.1 MAG: YggS family pyridoxal phosphate-dependent enzyme [Sphingobacteriales bacterium]